MTPLLEKLLAGHSPCSINSIEMLQENLKNQRDSVKKGRDTRQTGHLIFTLREFLSEILSPYLAVLSFKEFFLLFLQNL